MQEELQISVFGHRYFILVLQVGRLPGDAIFVRNRGDATDRANHSAAGNEGLLRPIRQACGPIRVHQRHLHPQGSVGPDQHEVCPHRKHPHNPQPIPGGHNQWQGQQLLHVDMEHSLIFCKIG